MAQNTLEVRRDIERIRAELDQTLDALGDHVRPSRIAERKTRGIRRTFTSARERVMGTASSAASSAGSGLHGAQELTGSAKDAPQWVAQGTRGNPLVAGMLSFGVGMLLGSLAPATKAERDAVDAMSDQLEPVRQAAMSVKDKAVDAGREAATHVAEEVQHAAQEVGSSAQQSVAEVKDQAQSGVQQVAKARQGS